jgi:hypothetical protein
MSDNLAKKLADAYTERLNASALQSQKFVEEQRIVKTQGPQRWADLRQLFRQTIKDVNKELKRDAFEWTDVHTNSLRIVRKDNNAILSASFDPESQILQFSGSASINHETYSILFTGGDAQFVLVRQSETGVRTPEEIVDKILGIFVNS